MTEFYLFTLQIVVTQTRWGKTILSLANYLKYHCAVPIVPRPIHRYRVSLNAPTEFDNPKNTNETGTVYSCEGGETAGTGHVQGTTYGSMLPAAAQLAL